MTTKRLALIIGAILCASFNIYASDSNTPMPLPFTKNMGQWPDSILFRASANGATMWFTKNGIWFQFFRRIEKSDASATPLGGPPSGWVPVNPLGGPAVGGIDAEFQHGNPAKGGATPRLPHEMDMQPDSIETTMIKAEFVGASESVAVVGLEELEYKCNYFIGNESDKWRTDVPNYGAVTMSGLYPGVDVTFASKEGRLESVITAASSTDLALVKVDYRGADNVTQLTSSSAMVQSTFGEHTFEGVMLSDGSASKSERQVSSASSSDSTVNLVYSTFLGGSTGGSSGDAGIDNAIDELGNAYVCGHTHSVDFPAQGAFQTTFGGGGWDVFVAKLNSFGSGLIYSTYLGGTGYDFGFGIAIDAGGNAYVTGNTNSENFPTQSPFQAFLGGNLSDAFVTKLNSDGNGLIYSTYLGGFDYDQSNGIAVDANGNAYVTGLTGSIDFPTQNPYQSSYLGSYDAFVTKFNSVGSGLIYSTYLGGDSIESGLDLSIDVGSSAYISGYTKSPNFPTQNGFQISFGGYFDAFVTKLSSAGNAMIYSTYLGGSDLEEGRGLAVDNVGSAYITGYTYSSNFPTQNPFQTTLGGLNNAFVSKLNNDGSSLIFSTYLGGDTQDWGNGIAVDVSGNVYVTGETTSFNFPTRNPLQAVSENIDDAFVTKLDASGNGLIYSTYIGGSTSGDIGSRIAVDTSENAYFTGETFSVDFPTEGAFQATFGGGGGDAFVTKLGAVVFCCENLRGNTNGDPLNAVNVVDITFLVQYLFQGGRDVLCKPEADVNGNGAINVVDVTTLVKYLFQNGPALPSCP